MGSLVVCQQLAQGVYRLLTVVHRLQSCQRMCCRLTRDVDDSLQLVGILQTLRDIVAVNLVGGRQVCRFLILLDEQVFRYAVVKTQSARLLVVQGFHIGYQLLALGKELVGGRAVSGRRLLLHDVEHLFHLLQEVLLRGLVGMQFQTEGCQSYLFQSRLYHRQGSHLLSNEEHALALVQRIGYHVGDGLRLTCAWRAVQDE